MMQRSAILSELLIGLKTDREIPQLVVNGLTLDSRELESGDVFIALKGAQFDARSDARSALEAGAAAVLVDSLDLDTLDSDLITLKNLLVVENLVAALSDIAGRFYDHPSRRLTLIGVTGTNGKTTISYYLAQMLDHLGRPAAVMGTLGAGRIGEIESTGMTTPDAVRTQKYLAQLLESGIQVVCIEVSSHALVLGRVAALNFDFMVFSNLSQDHLDFHHSMAAYKQAKMRLFSDFEFKRAIINCDDELGAQIATSLTDSGFCYGVNKGEIRASDIKLAPRGLSFKIVYDKTQVSLQTTLIGEFNVFNMLAVLGTGLAMGFEMSELSLALNSCHSAPGRMQRMDLNADQPVVVVDYAHTPDALDKALTACQSHCDGSLSVVFGCGGDRDRAKRPQMGRIAENRADQVFITDDNPRNELPSTIVKDIVSGMHKPAWILHDRAQAIKAAVHRAAPQDWVLIAGKGHETRQVYADRVLETSDRDLARQALAELAA